MEQEKGSEGTRAFEYTDGLLKFLTCFTQEEHTHILKVWSEDPKDFREYDITESEAEQMKSFDGSFTRPNTNLQMTPEMHYNDKGELTVTMITEVTRYNFVTYLKR